MANNRLDLSFVSNQTIWEIVDDLLFFESLDIHIVRVIFFDFFIKYLELRKLKYRYTTLITSQQKHKTCNILYIDIFLPWGIPMQPTWDYHNQNQTNQCEI